MKITCKQQDLSRGLSIVSHAVSTRNTLPILSNILLTTDNGRLKLSATNLEIGINCWVEASILEDGSTTIPAKLFSDFVSSLPQAQVELSVNTETHTATIKSLRSSAQIKGMNPEEYPSLPTVESNVDTLTLEASLLKEMISQVACAAAPDDDTRPIFTGVYVEMRDEQLTFAAADSFRLAVRAQSIPGLSDAQSILVPAKTLIELGRILPSEGTVEMSVTLNRSQVLFHTAQVDLVSRLIEGTFPNFRAIIPKEHNTRVVIETGEWRAAMKSVVPFARDSSNIVRIKIDGGGNDGLEPGSLTLEATAEDVGSNTSTIAAAVDGPEQKGIFNARYLVDVLNAIDTPEVALEMVSDTRPGAIKPVGGGDYTYVIMPMSTNR